MGQPQRDYATRLPYGYWFDPETRQEHLFDRGYNGIASRPVDKPWEVVIHPLRTYLPGTGPRVESWFYTYSEPGRDDAALCMCERVLARFCSGNDVRVWLKENRERALHLRNTLLPKTRGRYLPKSIPVVMAEEELAGENVSYTSFERIPADHESLG